MRQYLIFTLLLLANVLLAQDAPSLRWTLDRPDVQQWQADEVNFLYLVGKASIEKYDQKGQLLATYRENNLGPIAKVDVNNPFQILVFFEEYGKVVLLDRTLSEQQRFAVSDLDGGDFVQAIGLSSDNQIWLYDTEQFLLRKINRNGKTIRQSLDLSLLLPTQDFRPTSICEHQNTIFLHDPLSGIAIFDPLTNFIRFLPMPNQKVIHFFGLYIVYMEAGQLKSYNLSRREHQNETFSDFDSSQYDDIILTNFGFWAKKGTKISFFSLK
jgi:hypothetical protein